MRRADLMKRMSRLLFMVGVARKMLDAYKVERQKSPILLRSAGLPSGTAPPACCLSASVSGWSGWRRSCGSSPTGGRSRVTSDPATRFTYVGFGWVPKPTEPQLLALLALIAVAAWLVGAGWWYRPAIAVSSSSGSPGSS